MIPTRPAAERPLVPSAAPRTAPPKVLPAAVPAALIVILATTLAACGGSSGDDDTVPAADGTPGDAQAPGGDPASGGPSTPVAGNGDGAAADCARVVPCAWASADGALTLVLSAAQGERADDGGDLRVDLAASAASEGELALLTASSATAGDIELSVGLATLGDDVSGFSDRATARFAPSGDGGNALTLAASLDFLDAAPDGIDALDSVTVELLDAAGAPLQAVFGDVPLGGAVPNTSDCAGALPCTWSDPGGDVEIAITALDVRDIEGTQRLAVDYRVSALRAIDVASDGYTRAASSSGRAFAAAVLILGEEISRFGRPLEATLAAGESVEGTVGFDRVPAGEDTLLESLRLNLLEPGVPRVPRWNPVFGEVPLGG